MEKKLPILSRLKALRNRLKLFAEFRQIDKHIRESDGDVREASRSLFRIANWNCFIDTVLPDTHTYVLYSAHTRFVDSSVLNLVSPPGVPCRRIVNTCIPGRNQEYQRLNFTVAPKFRWRYFWRDCHDLKAKFFYPISHKWFRGSGLDSNELCQWLRTGNNLILFPSGVFGRARWRRGLGRLVNDYVSNRNAYQKPLLVVGLSLQFLDFEKTVTVSVVSQHDPICLAQRADADQQGQGGESSPKDVLITRFLEQHYASSVGA